MANVEHITNSIIRTIEGGTKPWRAPWATSLPQRWNGVPYRGINILLLWMAGSKYAASRWLTYRQALNLGGFVRKGERGTHIIFASIKEEEETERQYLIQRTYTVFNAEQIDNLPNEFKLPPAPALQEDIDRKFAMVPADIRHGGERAYYSIKHDYIQMPPIQVFEDANGYYKTLSHELVHWTGHDSRLDRSFDNRAMEELVAELGAAFVCASIGVSSNVASSHAEYISEWVTMFKNHKRAIYTAATNAQKARDYIINEMGNDCADNE